MAERAMCKICDKTFKNEEGLAMHNHAKHSSAESRSEGSSSLKKYFVWIILIGIIIAIVVGIIQLMPEREVKSLNVNLEGKVLDIPQGAVHWHPKLIIEIDDESIFIPDGIGHTIGRVMDTDLSGMRMTPTHTHTETDGTIHLENSNPSKRPETTTLGYFFYTWDKRFDSTCIFDYCTNNGQLVMTINGVENYEFQNYLMKDKDNILIKYTSNS